MIDDILFDASLGIEFELPNFGVNERPIAFLLSDEVVIIEIPNASGASIE